MDQNPNELEEGSLEFEICELLRQVNLDKVYIWDQLSSPVDEATLDSSLSCLVKQGILNAETAKYGIVVYSLK